MARLPDEDRARLCDPEEPAAPEGRRAGGTAGKGWRPAAAAAALGLVATLAVLAARGGLSAGPPPAAEPATASGAVGLSESKGQPGLTCGLEKDSKLLLLLSSSGIQGPEIKGSLDKMVSALPGAGGKANYSKLKLLEIYDPCMLKESFWNKDDKDFDTPTGMNYVKADIKNLTPDLVEPFDYKGADSEALDVSWCYNEWTDSSATGGLKDMGFASHTPVSIMDHMMAPEEFKALVHADLGVTGGKEAKALVEKLRQKPVPETLKALIEEADVIASCGGNPDLATFVYRAFPSVAELLTKKLKQGKAVYLGRSASSMVVGANAVFSTEPTPEMLENVLADNPNGLALLPKCIIRPHFKTETYEDYSSALEDSTGLDVVRMPNLAAWVCQSGSCELQGSPNPDDLLWKNSAGHYRQHLDVLFDSLN